MMSQADQNKLEKSLKTVSKSSLDLFADALGLPVRPETTKKPKKTVAEKAKSERSRRAKKKVAAQRAKAKKHREPKYFGPLPVSR